MTLKCSEEMFDICVYKFTGSIDMTSVCVLCLYVMRLSFINHLSICRYIYIFFANGFYYPYLVCAV